MANRKGFHLQFKSFSVVLVLIFMFLSSPVIGQTNGEPTETEGDPADLLNMSLEELMDIPVVTVASKIEEKVTIAPGIIKIYQADDIEKVGYYTISELAQITSGYGSQKYFDLMGLEVRGLPAGDWDNNKVLLLVDGISVNMGRNYHAWIEEGLPLYFADRVEFLKGPGSALYGTSAFLGVVNIISKDQLQDNKQFQVKLSGGNDPYNPRRLMANALFPGEKVSGKLFVGYFTRDARRDRFENSLFMLGSSTAENYSYNYDDTEGLFLNTSVRFKDEECWTNGITLGVMLLERHGGLGTGWMGFTHQIDNVKYQNLIPYLKYDRQITDELSVSSSLKYQRYEEEGRFSFRPENEPDPQPGEHIYIYDVIVPNLEGNLEFTYLFDKTMNCILGFNYDERYEKGGPKESGYGINTTSPYYHRNPTLAEETDVYKTTSVYAQLKKEFPVLQGLSSTLGVRYDNGESFEQLSPRVGFVQQITRNLGVKALYGSALKSPGVKEFGLNEEISGDSGSIEPETIETYETSLFWRDKKINASATYFCSKVEDPIARVTYDTNRQIFANVDEEYEAKGVELEGEYFFPSGKIFANATLQRSQDGDGHDMPFVPSIKASAGIMYNFEALDLDASVIVRYTDRYKRSGSSGDYMVDKHGDTVDGATVVDLNLSKAITENTTLGLQVKNLFNEKYSYPGDDSWQAYDYLCPGTTVWGSVTVQF